MNVIVQQSTGWTRLSRAAVGMWCLIAILELGLALRSHAESESASAHSLMAKASKAPEEKQKGQTVPAESNGAAVCEPSAQKAYATCMDGPTPDQDLCLRKADETERQCLTMQGLLPQLGVTEVKVSEGLYRIPYVDGTKVHVNRNFQDHNPPGKIDMVGRGGGPYRIVAAADGEIMYIEDSRDKQQHPKRWLRNAKCFNNFVWIKHDNGEWTKYSHMQLGTTTAKAKRKVGDHVQQGDYLGDEGHVGCAWPAHLHFEVVQPSISNPTVDPASGELELEGDYYQYVRNPRFLGPQGTFTFADGADYVVGGKSGCKKDDDCNDGQYCNAGIDLTKNACLPLKSDNEACEAVGGGHQCKSGKCQYGRCYTPQSVDPGNTCYVNDACKAGQCSDLQGVKGVCVCQNDADCGDTDKYCDRGMDFKLNACRTKLNKGEKCGKAGSVGNDHKCKSGECSGFPKYECK
ncbi:hypothetical protein COMA1_10555 [Candidatus Nitrospira nitrosa]|uniref:M23ase beta-sheet core domain-containing protein n=1 Tax=Candidatus Nitrospira nitrosa TaxID=1742972 RepID=A0A0S4L6T9_9BACT|nr:M23 family metallopeptidase [Candidatus Nitrospira nitrosa]CUS32296.1 hypothetical protein COMA1_10555 [Candidatus Nitrospira nitrosa]